MEMDIRHYFDAVDFSNYSESGRSNWRYSIGASIEKKSSSLTTQNIKNLDVVIIGAPFDSRNNSTGSSDTPDKIRKELYQLSKPENKISIADLGNLKPASSLKGNYHAVRDIVEYFNEFEIVTIILGGSQDLSTGVCEAFNSNQLFSYATIDAFLDIKKGRDSFNSTNYLSRVFNSQSNLFQFSLIGFQRHYIAPEYFSKTKGINHNIRLGKLRDNITLVEPVFRNSDVLSFDIGAIKYSEAPGNDSFSPNGLRSEEACQLAKYAGLSSRLKVFGLFEFNLKNDRNNLTTKLAAQIIWYFIEGITDRESKLPGENDQYIMYQVEVKNIDNPLVFYKNSVSGRWWMKIYSRNKKPYYFGCTEDEYIQASNNEIPELWLNYIQKLDILLK